jgi:hypothetical protein
MTAGEIILLQLFCFFRRLVIKRVDLKAGEMERFSERVKRYVDLVKQFKYQQTFNEFYDEDLTRIHNVGKWTLDAVEYKERMQLFLDNSENRKMEIKNVI